MVDALAARPAMEKGKLFGRHKADGAAHAFAVSAPFRIDRDIEVCKKGPTVRIDEDIGRLNIAVKDAAAMREFKCFGHLDAHEANRGGKTARSEPLAIANAGRIEGNGVVRLDAYRFQDVKPLVGAPVVGVETLDDLSQRASGHILQAQTMFAGSGVGELCVHLNDILVFQFRQRLSFVQSSPFRYLEGNPAIQCDFMRKIYRCEGAGAEFSKNDKIAEPFAWPESLT